MKFFFKKARRFWSSDWLLKFISVCLAVLLWFMVGGEDKIDKNVRIPVEIINLPRDLVISNQFKKEIEVTVNGPRSLILEITKLETTRQIDLTNFKPGSQVIDIPANSIKMPRGVTVQRVQPSSIILSLDKLVSRDLHIKARVIGKPAIGHVLQRISIIPDQITITGPQSKLARIKELKTIEINISGMSASSQLQVPLALEPAIVELIGETSVTADVEIGQIKTEKVIKDVPVKFEQDGRAVKTIPAVVSIKAGVPPAILAGGGKFEDFFTVTVADGGSDTKKEVAAIPKTEEGGQIEILSITPRFVEIDRPTLQSETSPPGKTDGVRIIKAKRKKNIR
ncbi:MAG: hypothetical protein CSB24_02075 [Deltaproteobacteria bacterium]|nr:MAG: hypothetical protein CSB24_02075 [Deltaproteobacteria bacterium]